MLKPPKFLPRVMRGVALGGALALGLALGGCLGYDEDFDRGYQVDEGTLSQVKVGATTKPQALALLGTPSTTSTVGGDAWYYIGQKMHHSLAFMPTQMTDQHVLAVYFDKSGKVDRIANYGMQDGKVFDFVSRTTPTAGREPDFLRNMIGGLFRFS
jgi:outer membrane protein assembly factor BamE (lipoprotein component of BamABCDE complex)